MQIGTKVLVPRTGGGETPGEVIELWGDHVRVRFAIGDYFHGKPAPEGIKGCYGYKTLKQSELKLLKEAVNIASVY